MRAPARPRRHPAAQTGCKGCKKRGPGKLAGPTGGYLIGFLFLALIQGFLMKLFPKKNTAAVIGMILGMAVCYLFGTAWLALQLELTFPAALSIGVLPYLAGDGAKIVIAAVAGPKLRTAVHRAAGYLIS